MAEGTKKVVGPTVRRRPTASRVKRAAEGGPTAYAVVLLEAGNGSLVGMLDGRHKKFLVLPGANAPYGKLGEFCQAAKANNDLRSTVYSKQGDAQADRLLMSRRVASIAEGREYRVALLPFNPK